MNKQNITIQLSGLSDDDKHVQLDVLAAQLAALKSTLDSLIESEAGPTSLPDHYNVISIQHNSPTLITIAPFFEQEKFIDVFTGIKKNFFASLNDICCYCTAPDNYLPDTLKSIKSLVSYVKKGKVAKLDVYDNETSFDVTAYKADTITKNIDTLITEKKSEGIEQNELGDVSGILESINIHEGKNTCWLYPVDGNKGIMLHFEKRHLAKLKVSIGEHITISGMVFYKYGDFHPYKVEVHTVEVHPKDDDLPSLLDLCGAAPGLTGGLSTEEFIREIRNEWG